MGKKYSVLDPGVSVAAILSGEASPKMPTPFLEDPVYTTPGGKRVVIVPDQDGGVLTIPPLPENASTADKVMYSTQKSRPVLTWSEARKTYGSSPESFAKRTVTLRYLGTGARGKLPFVDLSVPEEYIAREPMSLEDLAGTVVRKKSDLDAPEEIKLLGVGRIKAIYSMGPGRLAYGPIGALFVAKAEKLSEAKPYGGAGSWSAWWQQDLTPLSEILLGRQAPWDIEDRRNLSITSEATVSLAELLADSSPVPIPLIARTPCINPEGRRGEIAGELSFIPVNSAGDKEQIVRTWREARQLSSEGFDLKGVPVSYGSTTVHLAPEIVRIPVAALVSAPPKFVVGVCEAESEYDYEAGRVKVALKIGDEARTLEVDEAKYAELDSKLAELERARAALAEWVGQCLHAGEAAS